MGVTVGPVTPDRAEEVALAMGTAFGFDPEADRVERFRNTFEWDRMRTAYDGDKIVGTIGAFSLDMTVPGSTLPCAGTTVVAVMPTHRRRGILRMMIDSHLDDARHRNEPLAALWASDSGIYGRFGYGEAALGADVRVARDHGSFHRLAARPSPIRLVTAEEAAELLPPFYERVRMSRPGFFARSDQWWKNRRLRDPESERDGATAFRYAVTEENGAVTGYVQYRFKSNWTEGHGAGDVRIRELLGSTAESWAGLWRFVLDHDLTARIEASERPVDDPLFGLLSAPRRAHVTLSDSLWVRVMDVKTALEGRSYADTAGTVIQVHDPIDASLTKWRLDLSPEGSQVTPTDADAEVELDLEDLSACFMGRSRFRQLALAGRLNGEPSDIAALERAFAWSPAPWCPEVF